MAFLLAGLVLAACSSSAPAHRSNSAASPSPAGGSPSPATQGPRPGAGAAPAAPLSGTWIGAWVKPTEATPDGRMAAVADFEHLLGRPLDIVHVYHRWDEPFPSADDRAFAAAGKNVLLSWAGTSTADIAAGRYDDLIGQRADDLKAWGVPVLLEWRWEMDRPNLQGEIGGPQSYIAAWKHIRAVFATRHVTNVAWVWCPLAVGFVDNRAQPFYPGDDQVDWLCADTYPTKAVKPFDVAVGPFLDWAKAHPKPIVIAEFGMKKERGEDVRQKWLADMGRFVATQPKIKALVYFDADNTASTPSYDMSLRTAPGSMAVFRSIAREPHFDVRRSR